jgi:CheY-like chemotaxis protein
MASAFPPCPFPGPARPEETSVQPARGPGVPERVLIIDPSVEHRVFVASLLESAGCPVIAASRPDELLGQFDANPSIMAGVDLIIVDVADDAMVAVVKKVAADERLRDIPVIAMVQTPAPAALGEALSPGLGAVVRKPVTSGDLLVSLRTCMRLRWEITRRKELERELAEAQAVLNAVSCRLGEVVVLDPVTGLPNRRRMEEVLSAEWRRGLRTGTPLSLVMIDVDSFKIVNDTHGHQAGDECLRLVAATLVDVGGRTGDLVARYGGDEPLPPLRAAGFVGATILGDARRGPSGALDELVGQSDNREAERPQPGRDVRLVPPLDTTALDRGGDDRQPLLVDPLIPHHPHPPVSREGVVEICEQIHAVARHDEEVLGLREIAGHGSSPFDRTPRPRRRGRAPFRRSPASRAVTTGLLRAAGEHREAWPVRARAATTLQRELELSPAPPQWRDREPQGSRPLRQTTPSNEEIPRGVSPLVQSAIDQSPRQRQEDGG